MHANKGLQIICPEVFFPLCVATFIYCNHVFSSKADSLLFSRFNHSHNTGTLLMRNISVYKLHNKANKRRNWNEKCTPQCSTSIS